MENTNTIGLDKDMIKNAVDEVRYNLCSRLNFAIMNFPYKPSNEEKQELYKRIQEDVELLHSSVLFHANIISEEEFMNRNGYYLKENFQA